MAEPEKLTIQDAENAQKGVLALAMAYPDYPKLFKADNTTIRWKFCQYRKVYWVIPIAGSGISEKVCQWQLCSTDAISDGL